MSDARICCSSSASAAESDPEVAATLEQAIAIARVEQGDVAAVEALSGSLNGQARAALMQASRSDDVALAEAAQAALAESRNFACACRRCSAVASSRHARAMPTAFAAMAGRVAAEERAAAAERADAVAASRGIGREPWPQSLIATIRLALELHLTRLPVPDEFRPYGALAETQDRT